MNSSCKWDDLFSTIFSFISMVTMLKAWKSESKKECQAKIELLNGVMSDVKLVKSKIQSLKRKRLLSRNKARKTAVKQVRVLEKIVNKIKFEDRHLRGMLSYAIKSLNVVNTDNHTSVLVLLDDVERALEDIIRYIQNECDRIERELGFP